MSIKIKTANGYKSMAGTELAPLTVANLPEHYKFQDPGTTGTYQESGMFAEAWDWYSSRPARIAAFHQGQVDALNAAPAA